MTAFSGSGGSASYSYDGNGLRVVKSGGGTTTVSIFSGSTVIAEYDNSAAPTSPSREYIYNPAGGSTTGLLAMISGGATTYYHQDALSVRLTTDGSGSILTQDGTFPFGESWYQSGTTNKWIFTSYQRDSESGLDYALARYYDSRTGTFCSADPLAGDPSDPQSWNRYPYGRNDPIDMTDPSGKSWWSSLLIDVGVGVAAAFLPEIAPSLFGATATADGSLMVYPGATSIMTQTAAGSFVLAVDNPATTFSWSTSIGMGLSAGGMAAAANTPKTPMTPATPQGPQQPKKPCSVSADSLNKYLSSKNSPMAGQGTNLMNAGAQYDIDPRLLVSLSGAETGFGTNITAGQFNAFNVLYHGLNSPFASFQSAINSAGHSLANPRNGYDFTNTSTLYGHYCSGAGCSAGLKNVNTFMNQQGANTNSLHYPCKKE